MKKNLTFGLGLLLGFSFLSYGADYEEISQTKVQDAATVLTDYLSEDMPEISKIAQKFTILNMTQSENLPPSLQNFITKKIEQNSGKDKTNPVVVVRCADCNTVRAEADGDEIYIKKGLTSRQEIKKVLHDLNVKKYADIHVAYSDRYLRMQASIMDDDGVVQWSKEYKTPMNAYQDSQWIFGAGVEGVAYNNDALPSQQAYRLHVAQRLYGLGSAGLAMTSAGATEGLSENTTFSGVLELSHNEMTNNYWNYSELLYVLELGVTDFNGKQQFAETVGLKSKFGGYFSVRLAFTMNQFFKTPKDDREIKNDQGTPLLKNNEPLPARLSLGVGIEL